MPNTLLTEKFMASELKRIFAEFCSTEEQKERLDKAAEEMAVKLVQLGLIHDSKRP